MYYDFKKYSMSSFFEWTDSNFSYNFRKVNEVPYDFRVLFSKELERNKVINYSDVEIIEECSVRKILTSNKIKSFLASPFFIDDHYHGLIGFEQYDKKREWGENDIHMILALSIVLSQMSRRELAEKRFLDQKKRLLGQCSTSSIILSMQKILFEKSYETEEHAVRVAENCKKIGVFMGLSSVEINELELLAILHDIGKIAISDEILTKPEKLNDDEWTEMKKHPEIGCRIVQSVPELFHVAQYILYHHERWDGHGYPEGLKGGEIPLASRILAVADAYDAMRFDRPYRRGMTRKEAKKELMKNAGTQFDPDVIQIFLHNIDV